MAPSPLFRLTYVGFLVVGIFAAFMPKEPPLIASVCCTLIALVCVRCLVTEGSTFPEKVKHYWDV